VRASPVARRLAEELKVDLSSVRGTGPDGRILRRDIEAAAKGAPAPAAPERAAAPAGATTTVAPSRMRQTIARRMAQSKREAPHYYLVMEIDMTEAQRLRAQINEFAEESARVSVNDLIVKATAKALALHPIFNAWWVDDQVQQHADLNIAIAIALEEGLIAPAILDCGEKSLLDIARASRDLAERARSGVLKAEEYTGGTFTISNLGMFGVEALIGIISPPQTAILGVGAVQTTPVVRQGQVTTAEVMKVVLSADHRVTDGAQGSRFLQDLQRFLEKPAGLLL
jgi:pyruvate dehydrogenase E2 component (dihydrolipoamide acetyltransferase)